MLPGIKDNSQTTYQSILDIYQRCRRNGDWAKVYMETQDGREFFTISVQSSAGRSAGGAGVEKAEKVKFKKPSQVRRDRRRRSAFLERRNQEAAATPATPTPCTVTSEAGTDMVKEEEKVASKSVAGETSSLEDITGGISEKSYESARNDTTEEEEGLTKENIEQLREIIKASVQGSMTKKEIEARFGISQNNEMFDKKDSIDENDNFEDAKLWALKQKNTLNNNDLRS